MPTFTLTGAAHDYLEGKLEGDLEEIHSWEYGTWPRVEASVPLNGGGTVSVHGEAMRWGHGLIIARWGYDEGHMHSAWIPKDNVRRLTASEWDIIEYHQAPPELRSSAGARGSQGSSRIDGLKGGATCYLAA